MPASDVFELARRSVVLIETESGHGSGFLVDSGGLILTNHHVVTDTSYLAVGVEPGRKYPATVVVRDASRDLALIRINPDAVRGVRPLTLGSSAGVRIGEPVMAIGSAFTGDGAVLTMGRVSMVTGEKIIADLNVNSGTSGGPLLNERGQVIGICTFYMRAPAGPGLAGIVAIDAARSMMSAAASMSVDPPPLTLLPVASAVPYPIDVLRERIGAIQDVRGYGTTIGDVRIDVLTPPVVYFEAYQKEILEARAQGGRGSSERYVWQAKTGDLEAIVGIRVRSSGGFLRMRLLRNGDEVIPIVPGRFCPTRPPQPPPREAACLGLYQYSPEAFAPGANLELHVYLVKAPSKPRVWKLPRGLARTIWSDFEVWLGGARRDAISAPALRSHTAEADR